MKKILCSILSLGLGHTLLAGPTATFVPVMEDTNGALAGGDTNFFQVNSNKLNAAILRAFDANFATNASAQVALNSNVIVKGLTIDVPSGNAILTWIQEGAGNTNHIYLNPSGFIHDADVLTSGLFRGNAAGLSNISFAAVNGLGTAAHSNAAAFQMAATGLTDFTNAVAIKLDGNSYPTFTPAPGHSGIFLTPTDSDGDYSIYVNVNTNNASHLGLITIPATNEWDFLGGVEFGDHNQGVSYPFPYFTAARSFNGAYVTRPPYTGYELMTLYGSGIPTMADTFITAHNDQLGYVWQIRQDGEQEIFVPLFGATNFNAVAGTNTLFLNPRTRFVHNTGPAVMNAWLPPLTNWTRGGGLVTNWSAPTHPLTADLLAWGDRGSSFVILHGGPGGLQVGSADQKPFAGFATTNVLISPFDAAIVWSDGAGSNLYFGSLPGAAHPLDATKLAGTAPLAVLPAAVVTNNAAATLNTLTVGNTTNAVGAKIYLGPKVSLAVNNLGPVLDLAGSNAVTLTSSPGFGDFAYLRADGSANFCRTAAGIKVSWNTNGDIITTSLTATNGDIIVTNPASTAFARLTANGNVRASGTNFAPYAYVSNALHAASFTNDNNTGIDANGLATFGGGLALPPGATNYLAGPNWYSYTVTNQLAAATNWVFFTNGVWFAGLTNALITVHYVIDAACPTNITQGYSHAEAIRTYFQAGSGAPTAGGAAAVSSIAAGGSGSFGATLGTQSLALYYLGSATNALNVIAKVEATFNH